MKITFENKILFGFIINLLVVVTLAWSYITQIKNHGNENLNRILNWVIGFLFLFSLVLLMVVYFIIRAQLRIKNHSQKLLLDNQQLLQSIVDNSSNLIFIKKINGEYLLINKQYASLFEVAHTTIIGKTDADFLAPELVAANRNSDMEVVKALKEIKTEETISQADGLHTYWSIKFPLFDSTGRIYAVGGIATDITERKKLEEEQKKIAEDLFENKEKLRVILENISEGILVANVNKKTILANTMANDFFGEEEDEKISPNFINHFELYYPDEKTIFPSQNLPMERALKGEESDDVDVVLWNPATQEKRRVLISGRPLIDQNNNIVAGVVTIKDISKYKKLEEELKDTESKYRQLIGFKKEGK